MVEQSRIRKLNDIDVNRGDYILYWMQSSQRLEYNHALFHAIKLANRLEKPLLVAFCVTKYPEANLRHYRFMFEGILEVQEQLQQLGTGVSFKLKNPVNHVSELSNDASILLLDKGYLRQEKEWYVDLLRNISIPAIQVESNVIIPVEETSNKDEYAARTFRGKVNAKIEAYLKPIENPELNNAYHGEEAEINMRDLRELKIEKTPGESSLTGGYYQAKRLLEDFIANKLDSYQEMKNDPTLDNISNLSPYLHFGQISPVEISLKVKESNSPGIDAYLEELIVRRELAVNFVHYNPNYENIKCLPDWCTKTLNEHRKDLREYTYSSVELEKSETHDSYWNAAQNEMVKTGKMHGYMRMYWGKKIIEWTRTPEEAYQTMLYLNNKYELDGRDPNGYTGVAWCFGKHDRPWKERPIFGKIRYMNEKGLERKYKISKYVERWDK